MSLAGRQKLKKVADLTVKNVTREAITEVEVFVNTVKAFVDSPMKRKRLDAAFEKMRNRIFDWGGEESRRFQRYLDLWEVEQISDELDWTEYGLGKGEGRDGR